MSPLKINCTFIKSLWFGTFSIIPLLWVPSYYPCIDEYSCLFRYFISSYFTSLSTFSWHQLGYRSMQPQSLLEDWFQVAQFIGVSSIFFCLSLENLSHLGLCFLHCSWVSNQLGHGPFHNAGWGLCSPCEYVLLEKRKHGFKHKAMVVVENVSFLFHSIV